MTEKASSNFKQSFFAFSFALLLLAGCFTCATRHRIGCHCFDGTESSATGSGACSHHDGVMHWEYSYWWDK